MRRIAKLAFATALAAAAAWAVRRLLERADHPALEPARPEPAKSPRASSNGASRTTSSGGSSGPTRDELYTEAQRLEIDGRSKMNKKELQEAVAAAKTGGSE